MVFSVFHDGIVPIEPGLDCFPILIRSNKTSVLALRFPFVGALFKRKRSFFFWCPPPKKKMEDRPAAPASWRINIPVENLPGGDLVKSFRDLVELN